MLLYKILDIFFLIFHSGLILFNLFGWIWKKLRKLNLLVLLLTGLSWTLLGIWYGFGYCPVTDWHWRVLHRMGETELPSSYVQYLAKRIFQIDISPELADGLTGGLFLVALIISILLNIRDFKRKKSSAVAGNSSGKR